MKIEIRSRTSGKTTEHAAWLKEETDEDRLLLVATESQARYIREWHGLTLRQVMSWSARDVGRRLTGRRPVIRIEEGQDLVTSLVQAHLRGNQVDVLQLCADHVEIGA